MCVLLGSFINDKQHDDDVRGCTAVVGEMITFFLLTYHIMFHVMPAAHAKPHAQQQIACDLEVDYETNPPMSEGHPISMVCSRSGVRVYAATPRSWPCLLCAAARFVSAMTT